MNDRNLPADLVEYLQQGAQPDYDPAQCEAGVVKLLPLEKLKVEYFPMSPDTPDDPHAGEYGSYLVIGVSLLAECEGYRPDGLLLWLPLDGRYGTWDGEHETLQVFDVDVNWSEISKDLPRYINSQWGLDGSAPISGLVPWGRHPYNAEQLNHALPDIPEWYELSWCRRGEYRDGVQLRYPEELRIRVDQIGDQCRVTVSTKKAEQGAEWSLPEVFFEPSKSLERMRTQLDHGFWRQPTAAPGRPGGETSTYWCISGFVPVKYHSLHRFYEEGAESGDPVHGLGKEFARLAKLKQFDDV